MAHAPTRQNPYPQKPILHVSNPSEPHLESSPVLSEKRRRRRAFEVENGEPHPTPDDGHEQSSARPPRYTMFYQAAGSEESADTHPSSVAVAVPQRTVPNPSPNPNPRHYHPNYPQHQYAQNAAGWAEQPRFADIRPLTIRRPQRTLNSYHPGPVPISSARHGGWSGEVGGQIHPFQADMGYPPPQTPTRPVYVPQSASLREIPRRAIHPQPYLTSSGTSGRPPLRLDVQGLWYGDEDEDTGYTSSVPPHLRYHPEMRHPPPHPVHVYDRGPTRTTRPVVSHQPRHQPGMKLVGSRNTKGMPYAADGTRDWSTDLCLFCDHNLGTCCKALWCPCIIYGRNKARVQYLYEEEKVHPDRGGTFSDDCLVHGCLTTFCLFGWAMQIPNRAFVRRRYGIEGDRLGDCAAALCCSPCSLSQESREIDLEERSYRVWAMKQSGGAYSLL